MSEEVPWLLKELDEKEAEIAALRAENEGLLNALEPFGKFFDQFDRGQWADSESHWTYPNIGITVGDLRAARAALEKSGRRT